MQQFNNVVIEMKFTVKEEISYNERDMTYNISFQVSYSICNLYLTKLTWYQNPKRNFEMIKSMGNFCVARQLFPFLPAIIASAWLWCQKDHALLQLKTKKKTETL